MICFLGPIFKKFQLHLNCSRAIKNQDSAVVKTWLETLKYEIRIKHVLL